VGSYYQSAHRLLGGGRSLAKAYEAALAAAKVTIMTKQRLTGILSKETGAGAAAHELTGLQFADGERLDCRTAVATVHPQLVAALAPASTFRQVYRQRLAAAEDSFSAYAVFAATTRPIPLLEQGNLHVGQHPSFHLDRPADSPLEQRPLFLAQSIFSQVGAPDRAHFQPSGVAILCPASLSEVEPWLATRVGRRPAAYRARKADVGRRILAKALAVYPELEGGLAEAAYATPLTFRDYSHSPQGSLYGMRRGVDALAPLPVTRLKGLYLAGQAVTGPGVLGAIISAFIACGAVFGNDDLLEEVGRCRRRAS
jgi:all-trans-retinol 13,14-reductase